MDNRKTLFPEATDTWKTIALRLFPELPEEEAIGLLQSWNLHVFARPVATEGPRAGNPILPSDIIFLEPPLPNEGPGKGPDKTPEKEPL